MQALLDSKINDHRIISTFDHVSNRKPSSLNLIHNTSRVHDLVPLAQSFKCLLSLVFVKRFTSITTSSIFPSPSYKRDLEILLSHTRDVIMAAIFPQKRLWFGSLGCTYKRTFWCKSLVIKHTPCLKCLKMMRSFDTGTSYSFLFFPNNHLTFIYVSFLTLRPPYLPFWERYLKNKRKYHSKLRPNLLIQYFRFWFTLPRNFRSAP
jgi:hypothetical protein